MTQQPTATDDATYACTRTQQAIWFGEQVADHAAGNNLPLAIDLRGRVDEAALQAALTAVVAAQPALRQRFSVSAGQLRQHPLADLRPRLEDVSPPSPQAVERWIRSASEYPLDLLERPYRLALLRTPTRLVFFGNFHHGIFDGLSKELFAAQTAAAYGALVSGRDPALPAGLDDARRVAAEHRQIERLADLAETEWTALLRRLDGALEFPFERAERSAAARADALRFELEPRLKLALARVARRCDVSLFVLLAASVQLLQHAHSGLASGDVATAIPFGTRSQGELETIGLFVNEMPLCSAPRPGLTLPRYLAEVRAAVAALAELRQFPANEAVRRFGAGSDPSRLLPRFAITYWRAPVAGYRAGGVGFAPDRALPTYGTRWSARFRFVELPRRVQCALEFDVDALSSESARGLRDQLQTLLHEIASDPQRPLGKLPLLPPGERARLVRGWNRTAAPLPAETVQEAFAAQVARTPQRVAVRFGTESLTYAALARESDLLAGRLASHGAKPGSAIAICLDRSPRLPIALLAVLKAGAAFVPLDPSNPSERVALMLRDSGAELIVTERRLAQELPPELPRLCLDQPARAAVAADTPAVRATGGSVGCVIYTSGSTGRPKGALIPQRALVNLALAMAQAPGLDADDVYLSVTTPSFDVGTAELIAPLLAGSCLRIAPTSAAQDSVELARLLNASDATITFGTPSRWRLLLAAGWEGRQRVLTAGEALTPELAHELVARAPEVWNAYGPAETFAYSTIKLVGDPDDVTIGRPIANTTTFVVDRAGALAPTGVPGELWIGGSGVANGYLDRPRLTGERFVEDRFGGSGTLYRTGDLVRQRDDGELEFHGRIDDQVKIRGFRVEPGEVQAALAQLPGVTAAAVVVREDRPGRKQIVAYLVPDQRRPALDELRSGLARTLPDYMIPSAFVTLDELPLSPTGKVDRQRLPAPAAEDLLAGPVREAPRGPIEESLAALWRELLGVPEVGRDDDFFALGGDSLLAAEAVARAADRLSATVTVRMLFAGPTVARLADAIGSADALEDAPIPVASRAPAASR